ncbi:sulfur carrier protein ThiS [Prochlorococcus sp. MIT 1307]|uniref:sulfur carrier protein ThiS n=1 Tax=Prochlorococcus sp. MIT 1307 TaxID=3096219 RepID=UPI002A76699A|nr:sulfur carrier protein ThiS [Prochlorococcus sp. MIT 1307]
MRLTINGEEKAIEPSKNPLTLSKLIEQLGHHPRLIVVEFNGAILPPDKWEQQNVEDGDTLEIVTIVGGGS